MAQSAPRRLHPRSWTAPERTRPGGDAGLTPLQPPVSGESGRNVTDFTARLRRTASTDASPMRFNSTMDPAERNKGRRSCVRYSEGGSNPMPVQLSTALPQRPYRGFAQGFPTTRNSATVLRRATDFDPGPIEDRRKPMDAGNAALASGPPAVILE